MYVVPDVSNTICSRGSGDVVADKVEILKQSVIDMPTLVGFEGKLYNKYITVSL
jgi:hypothetical protein